MSRSPARDLITERQARRSGQAIIIDPRISRE